MAFSNTLAVVRQYLSSVVGDLILSTAGGTPTSTTYVDTKLLRNDDYYNEHHYRGYCYYGTAIGQEREVSDWTLTTPANTITFAPAFSPAPAAGDEFELHHIFSEDEYRKAINLGIGSCKYLIGKIDVTIVLVADTYEYTLPADMDYIHKITTEKTAGGGIFDESDAIDPRDWRLISPRKLKLHEDYYSVTAGKDLRIEGQGRQALVTADTDIIYLPLDWLVQKAIASLPSSKIQSNQLTETYRRALTLSVNEPRNSPRPDARRVVE